MKQDLLCVLLFYKFKNNVQITKKLHKVALIFLNDQKYLRERNMCNSFTDRPKLKFIHSEKATKFCEISTLLLTVCTVVKSTAEISQNFVASSEYMNFT